MTTVSLDEYRDEDVRVFGGTGRGRAVAEAIREEHGTNIVIDVPEDVLYICTHFRAGFHEVLPEVDIPDTIESD